MNSRQVRRKSSVVTRKPFSMKKFRVFCETWPRSRSLPLPASLSSQRNSFRPLETRVGTAAGPGAVLGPGAAGAADIAERVLSCQFILRVRTVDFRVAGVEGTLGDTRGIRDNFSPG